MLYSAQKYKAANGLRHVHVFSLFCLFSLTLYRSVNVCVLFMNSIQLNCRKKNAFCMLKSFMYVILQLHILFYELFLPSISISTCASFVSVLTLFHVKNTQIVLFFNESQTQKRKEKKNKTTIR